MTTQANAKRINALIEIHVPVCAIGKSGAKSTKPCRTGISCHESPAQARAFSSLSLGLFAALLPVSLVSPAQTGALAGRHASLPAAIADDPTPGNCRWPPVSTWQASKTSPAA
jgi:hypothetical protein